MLLGGAEGRAGRRVCGQGAAGGRMHRHHQAACLPAVSLLSQASTTGRGMKRGCWGAAKLSSSPAAAACRAARQRPSSLGVSAAAHSLLCLQPCSMLCHAVPCCASLGVSGRGDMGAAAVSAAGGHLLRRCAACCGCCGAAPLTPCCYSILSLEFRCPLQLAQAMPSLTRCGWRGSMVAAREGAAAAAAWAHTQRGGAPGARVSLVPPGPAHRPVSLAACCCAGGQEVLGAGPRCAGVGLCLERGSRLGTPGGA